MWRRIKKKIKQLFHEDHQSVNSTSQYTAEQTDHRLDAKVSYRYPKTNSYRFPMPIDPPESRYYDEKRPQRTLHTINEASEVEKNRLKRKPFRVSDVPSPVYGFNDSKAMKAPIEKPAYLRRERNKPLITEEQHEQIDEELINEDLQNNHQTFERDDITISDEQGTERLTEPEKRENVEHAIDMQSKEEPIEKDRRNQKVQRNHPFNVRMTPSDKRRRDQKRKTVVSSENQRPPLHLLDDIPSAKGMDQRWVNSQSERLTTTLAQFNVNADVVNVMQGPSVTRFEIQLESGTKVSKVKNLSDDIKLNMAAEDIRIEAPIPGKNAIGIEIPNPTAQPVGLLDIFKSETFYNAQSPLTIGLGLDISGQSIVSDIRKMPHGLIAGATGSGKSVCINAILLSLLFKASPKDVRLMLVDPKMVELAPYNEIPHLVSPVITDVKAATQALKWAVEEMELRYQKFVDSGTRDIERYNQKIEKQNNSEEKLPYLIIVIDELADLMMAAPQDVEDAICRIAQKARACGIHLLLATQRPSVDVITGLIKANIPTRIAFSVASQVDSRTMIDTNGAERLLGKGDMLFVENGARTPLRIQGAFVSDEEIERITSHVRQQGEVNYLFEQEQLIQRNEQLETEDELYQEALTFVLENNSISTSLLQRRFKIGYNRAARLIDALEEQGVISGQNGSKPRSLLVSKEEYNQL
ncbi:DNA translocase FtsK [Amphibacillus jilinensis]|uniref:DNA translocase FtsK n=1 Tax=Amphibacillus jilinensis TaxID=1216008 RepID=UPI000317D899|nr:DNA translocase FtsK [Amphibacillus jilinensis]